MLLKQSGQYELEKGLPFCEDVLRKMTEWLSSLLTLYSWTLRARALPGCFPWSNNSPHQTPLKPQLYVRTALQ